VRGAKHSANAYPNYGEDHPHNDDDRRPVNDFDCDDGTVCDSSVRWFLSCTRQSIFETMPSDRVFTVDCGWSRRCACP
jgi:hypothetical protein